MSKFTFTYKDDEQDSYTLKEFKAGTWYEALDEFVKFLRGCGFAVTDTSVGINESVGHLGIEDLFLMNVTTFE